MARKKKDKKNPPARTPASPRWEFGPDVPTHDFFESGPLDDSWHLQQAVDGFVWWVEEGHFLTWEAVVCEEQGLPLTAEQRKSVGDLLNFNDEGDDEILYIDETPRPSQPWHVILNSIAPRLLIEPFRTSDVHQEVQVDGWKEIAAALGEHGRGLSRPPGVNSPEEVVPADLRHRLWLQACVDVQDGLGQDEELTLGDPEQHYRVGECLDELRRHRDSVAHLGLTLDSLLARVVLPDRDRPIFVTMVRERLGLTSDQEPLAGRL